MSKGLKIFLTVSVLLNVLLAGILIGAFSHTILWRMDKGKRAFSFARSLPPAKRDMLIDTMKNMKNESRETRKKIKKARQEVLDAFSAPEFDPERFDRSVAALHALMKELTDEIAGETKKIALDLSPEERKQLADMMRRGPGPPFPQFLMERSFGHGGPPLPPRSGDEDWHDGPGGNQHDEPD